ncbi:hypothetical protein QJ850_gp224 [Acanthamoeba polyphaga mimivirus]|uniref:Ankyrin repeat protein n=1 Tax=Acanthamoeba polyphaga mimivirus Kroon TaxID=3069720 RepID=A0A0G2Y3T9_9VIRU|nr:hypothetical protein QJ850_gp224 [Acanthamoeba polyphaga mimivirus]AKI80475.1 hypothetical protein [Acanthamoeba polyphaga mimivirus Kroon]
MSTDNFYYQSETYYMIIHKSWLKIIDYKPESKFLVKMQFNHCIEKRGYFFTEKNHILDYIYEGDTIVSITLPQNFDELIIIRDGKGWRSNQIVIENTFKLHDINTVKSFHVVGVNDQQIANLAIKHLDTRILRYLISMDVELKSNITYIQWWNKICTDRDNPERYFVKKLLYLVPFYVVSHGSSRSFNYHSLNRGPLETQVHDAASGKDYYVQNFYFTDANNVIKIASGRSSNFIYKVKPYLNTNNLFNNIIREATPNGFWTTCVINNSIYDLTKEDSYNTLIGLGFNIEDLTLHALKKNWIKIVCFLISRHNFDTIFKTKLLFTATALGNEHMIYELTKHQPMYNLSQTIIDSKLSASFIMHHELGILKMADLPVPEKFADTFLVLAIVGGSMKIITAFYKKNTEYFNKNKQLMMLYAKHYSKPDFITLLENLPNNPVC